jgi:hypothetical protein
MEITTAQIELLALEEPTKYINFTNSEFFKKDTFKTIYDEIVSHGHIFDIILDKGSNNYTRPIEALSAEEALSLKMLLSDNYNPNEILKNAIQYKNIRLLFADVPDKDSYYYLVDFMHNNDLYISIILLKDFPADESSNIQYSIIRDVIELYFAMSFKKLGIPINYDESTNSEIICFPATLRSSDFIFISNYFAYYLEALSVFIPISALENTINDDGLSLLIDSYDNAFKVLHNRDKVINGTSSDLVDYAYMITKSYFNSVIQIARLTNEDMAEANKNVIESEEGNTDD